MNASSQILQHRSSLVYGLGDGMEGELGLRVREK